MMEAGHMEEAGDMEEAGNVEGAANTEGAGTMEKAENVEKVGIIHEAGNVEEAGHIEEAGNMEEAGHMEEAVAQQEEAPREVIATAQPERDSTKDAAPPQEEYVVEPNSGVGEVVASDEDGAASDDQPALGSAKATEAVAQQEEEPREVALAAQPEEDTTEDDAPLPEEHAVELNTGAGEVVASHEDVAASDAQPVMGSAEQIEAVAQQEEEPREVVVAAQPEEDTTKDDAPLPEEHAVEPNTGAGEVMASHEDVAASDAQPALGPAEPLEAVAQQEEEEEPREAAVAAQPEEDTTKDDAPPPEEHAVEPNTGAGEVVASHEDVAASDAQPALGPAEPIEAAAQQNEEPREAIAAAQPEEDTTKDAAPPPEEHAAEPNTGAASDVQPAFGSAESNEAAPQSGTEAAAITTQPEGAGQDLGQSQDDAGKIVDEQEGASGEVAAQPEVLAGEHAEDGDAAAQEMAARPAHWYEKCEDETDADPRWYQHDLHLLIFTNSGKPVFSRFGSEDGLSGTTATLSAIVSKIQSFFFSSDKKDTLRYMTAGDHIFAFVEKGPLWLVCITRCGNTYYDLVRLLERVHLQLITILTRTIEQMLEQRPNYDMRNLLGGTDAVVNNLLRWCTRDMYLHVDGFEPLVLPPAHRAIAVDTLRSAKLSNVLMGFIMASQRIVALVANRQYRVNALDIVILLNLILSSGALRTAESWTPICLPHLNDKAFTYAYISFIEDSEVGIVFLSTTHEGEQFYSISQHASTMKRVLNSTGCLQAIKDAMQQSPVSLQVPPSESSPGGTQGTERQSSRRAGVLPSPFTPAQARLLEGIIHAAYYNPQLQQFFSSSIAPSYQTDQRTEMLFRNYGRCRHLLRTAKMPSQICLATDHECFYVSLANDFHIYLAVPRGISTGVISLFYQWAKAQESHIFLGQVPVW